MIETKVMTAKEAMENPPKPMTNAEKRELQEVIDGMNEEAMRITLKSIPTEYLQDELTIRGKMAMERLSDVWNIMQRDGKDDMSLSEMECMIINLRTALKGA